MIEYIQERNRRQRERYKANMAYAIEKLGGRCNQCGTEEELEFDHINPATKKYLIGQLLRGSRTRLDEELTKCQLLCRDCHLEKTTFERELEEDARGILHGTVNSYQNKGCRCQECKLAGSIRNRENAIKRLTRQQ